MNLNHCSFLTSESSQADSVFAERLARVRARMFKALKAADRVPDSVRLVAMSKFHSCESILALSRAGQKIFGENYLQEARQKQTDIAALPGPKPCLEWHFTGHLQSNKAKHVLGNFSLIHTMDSISLGQALSNAWQSKLDEGVMLPPQEVLIQVNTGREPQKGGVLPEALPYLAEELHKIMAIRIIGLMCLPPLTDKPDDSRQHFVLLRELKERLSLTLGCDLLELSMGMSHDFDLAIAEGATLIRVGTDIFGPRQDKESGV